MEITRDARQPLLGAQVEGSSERLEGDWCVRGDSPEQVKVHHQQACQQRKLHRNQGHNRHAAVFIHVAMAFKACASCRLALACAGSMASAAWALLRAPA